MSTSTATSPGRDLIMERVDTLHLRRALTSRRATLDLRRPELPEGEWVALAILWPCSTGIDLRLGKPGTPGHAHQVTIKPGERVEAGLVTFNRPKHVSEAEHTARAPLVLRKHLAAVGDAGTQVGEVFYVRPDATHERPGIIPEETPGDLMLHAELAKNHRRARALGPAGADAVALWEPTQQRLREARDAILQFMAEGCADAELIDVVMRDVAGAGARHARAVAMAEEAVAKASALATADRSGKGGAQRQENDRPQVEAWHAVAVRLANEIQGERMTAQLKILRAGKLASDVDDRWPNGEACRRVGIDHLTTFLRQAEVDGRVQLLRNRRSGG